MIIGVAALIFVAYQFGSVRGYERSENHKEEAKSFIKELEKRGWL